MTTQQLITKFKCAPPKKVDKINIRLHNGIGSILDMEYQNREIGAMAEEKEIFSLPPSDQIPLLL